MRIWGLERAATVSLIPHRLNRFAHDSNRRHAMTGGHVAIIVEGAYVQEQVVVTPFLPLYRNTWSHSTSSSASGLSFESAIHF